MQYGNKETNAQEAALAFNERRELKRFYHLETKAVLANNEILGLNKGNGNKVVLANNKTRWFWKK